jgi:hypothetical protein
VHTWPLLALALSLRRDPAPHDPYHGLTRGAILQVLSRAQEVGTKGERLALFGRIVTVPDGHGGTLTAALAVRFPTADGYGQLVLFWHDKAFLGSDNLTRLPNLGPEAISVDIARVATNSITLRFARYRPNDPMVAPSLPPGFVRYSVRHGRLVASGPVPKGATNGLTMELRP